MNNITNNRWLSVIILLLLTANIVTLALLWTNKSAERRGMQQPSPPQGQVFEFLTNELKLDSAQQDTYKKLREEHRDGQRELQDSIRKTKDAFFALLKQPGVSDSLLRSASSRAAAADQMLDEFTFRHFQKVRAICNAEQQKKFDEIIQDALHRMAPPRRPGPPSGVGPENEQLPPPPGS